MTSGVKIGRDKSPRNIDHGICFPSDNNNNNNNDNNNPQQEEQERWQDYGT